MRPYGEDRHYWKGHFVRELSDELIDDLLARMAELDRPPGARSCSSRCTARRRTPMPPRELSASARPPST